MTPPGSLSVLLLLCLAPELSSQCPGPEAGHRGHYSPRQCSADLISQAVAASEVSACQPRPQVVRLPWPNNTEVHQMTPTHVEVFRCQGGCHSGLAPRSCVALTSRRRSVPVMLGKCGLGAGRCDKECASVEVEEHTGCMCGCDPGLRAACEARGQMVYREETCQCQCRDIQARKECEERGLRWSEATCTCVSEETPDIVGEILDNKKTNSVADDKDDSGPVNDADDGDFMTREIIVIILLSAINSCLMLIVFLLTKRLRQVRGDMGDMDRSRDYYQVSQDDSVLKKPKIITNNTYSEIDIYSASSGFVSEDGSTKDQERIDTLESCPAVDRQSGALQEAFYETAESVRLKKYQIKEAYHKNDLTVEKAMQSIDETMKMLQVTAEKL